jgi:integrase/recombinase XerD
MSSVKIVYRTIGEKETAIVRVYIRIIKQRKTRFISAGVTVKASEWNEKDLKVRKCNSEYQRLNALIKENEAKASRTLLNMELESEDSTATAVQETIKGKKPLEFFPYFEKYNDSLKAKEKIGTYKRAKTVLEKLKAYRKSSSLLFTEITVTFLKDYENYLIVTLKNKPNTIHSNFKIIRKLMNDAIIEDIIKESQDPFKRYKIKTEPTTRAYLTDAELELIEKMVIPKDQMMNHHRNIYVFSAYAGGLRISDVLTLKWENFNGEHVTIKIHKTKTALSVKLPQKALDIVNQYKPKGKANPKDYIFPLLPTDIENTNATKLFNAISSATAYTNKDLKAIAKKVKIQKHISFHSSRHTFATRALRKGMRIEYVSKLMGHAQIKETQIYAKIVNEELDKAMDIFND